jgi:hypothetical protein
MSFEAVLIVQGEDFNVRRFSWGVRQNTDAVNRPDAHVQGGQLQIELDSQPSDLLHFWALDDTKSLRMLTASGSASALMARALPMA